MVMAKVIKLINLISGMFTGQSFYHTTICQLGPTAVITDAYPPGSVDCSKNRENYYMSRHWSIAPANQT